MGAELVLAIVLGATITHAWETGKKRSAAAWRQARQRAAEKAAERAKARNASAARFTAAKSKGPRDPLWWAYTAGRLLAGTGSALGAGVRGVVDGAREGARTGYRVGKEGAEQGWKHRDTWRAWKRQRADAPPVEDPPLKRYPSERIYPEADTEPAVDADPVCAVCRTPIPAGGLDEQQCCRSCVRPELEPAPRSEGTPEGLSAGTLTAIAERVDTPPKEGTEMDNLPVLRAGGVGEGFTDTLNTLQVLTQQIAAAKDTAVNLVETLTANEIDSETIANINQLFDFLEAAAPLSEATLRHVEQRHAPVAEAIASAGGSDNVAQRSWYDDL